MESLVDAFLMWQKTSLELDYSLPEDMYGKWGMEVIDNYGWGICYFTPGEHDLYTNMTLVKHGCLGSAPQKVSVAIVLHTLELYRETRWVTPRHSVQAEVRKLCTMNRIPYHHYLTTQFSIAYDIHLEILWHVKQQVDAVLSCNMLNWRIQNSCPCCQYCLEAELALVPLQLIAVDGNNSLRQVDASLTKGTNLLLDSRITCTDLWLTRMQVDVFKNEIKAKAKSQKKDDTWLETGKPGDVTSGADAVMVCIERWKNGGPEEQKKMWEMFDETGVFIMVCWHGFLLIMCNMVKSGKLCGLAITDKILKALGDNIGEGYDIGCAFTSTVNSSILLGDKVCQRHLHMIVPAFHGHTHNHSCQLSWHPLYITRVGVRS
ncbi:hypothetical protein K439DRAFT_1511399 [Ramaria rubella]|nr:hypothetical protein K439DRAFT_1511399 [Ramaria rubella]